MKKKYILTIDEGTTSARVILFDKFAKEVASSQMEFTQICKNDGWVEHNPEEIWLLVCQLIKNVLNISRINVSEIDSIAITNQRETTVLWNKHTGKPIYNAIVWQSRQSKKICDELIASNLSDEFKEKTGLIINPYFSASKIKWIFDNVAGALEQAKNGDVLFGTIDTYLLWKITGGMVHATDYSNASRTLIYNINTLSFDEKLMEYFDIPRSILPNVLPSSHIFGYAKGLSFIDNCFNDTPISAVVGDQQASLFGQCCFDEGSTKITYGTGCFILMNTKNKLIQSKQGLLTTIAWGIGDEVEYALEGSVFVSGSAITWLRDGLCVIDNMKELDIQSSANNPSAGVYMVPAFVGLGTPYWDNDARGAIFGITRATTKENVIAATLEASPYQANDVMDVMVKESGFDIKYVGVDGGCSKNDYMMQFQADLLGSTIARPFNKETTALGATYLAGLATGFFKSKDEIKRLHQIEKVFVRQITEEEKDKKIKGWKTAVNATLDFKN